MLHDRPNIAASIAAKRAATRARLSGASIGQPPSRISSMLDESRGRVQSLLAHGEDAVISDSMPQLTVSDLHTIDRLLSHIRHSVVRVCFYNLNLLCPSLVDEYDDELRLEIERNLSELPRAKGELDSFFATALSDGALIGAHWPAVRDDTDAAWRGIEALSKDYGHRLEESEARNRFGNAIPEKIQHIMDSLQRLQNELDTRKITMDASLEQAVALCTLGAREASLAIRTKLSHTSKIFGDERLLQNAFVETITNVIRHSKADTLEITAQVSEDKQFVEIVFQDDGIGMSPEQVETCIQRGVSYNDGTGEGLAMVVEIIEAEHLGEVEVRSSQGKGCMVTMRIPVKYQPRRVF